jgi:hypothetical protein
MTVTPLKPETGEGYVIKNRQASEKPAEMLVHCDMIYVAMHK